MKISVVIPLYNKREHIRRCIESVTQQTVPPHEVIVVDDGSTDGSAEELTDYQSTVKVIRQKNSGESAARNTGISAATGELIAFLDADDSWKPWFLEKICRLVKQHPNGGLYALSYEFVTPNSSRSAQLAGMDSAPWHGEINYFRVAAFGDPPVTSSTAVVRKSVFESTGVFPVGKRMGPDGDMWGRIALKYPIILDTTVGATYYLDATNRVSFSFRKTDDHPFIETFAALNLSTLSSEKANDLKVYILRLKLNDARRCVINGEFKKARAICKGENYRPFLFRRLAWSTPFNYATFAAFLIYQKLRY